VEIGDYMNKDPWESTLSSDIEEDDFDHQQKVLLLGPARRDKSLQNTKVRLPKNRNHSDTVIAHPLLPNSWNPAGAMEPPLLKRQKSTLLNNLSESDRAPSTQALPPRNSSGDQNVPQPNASADQNFPQHQKATFGVAKRFMEAIVFTKTPWPVLSNDKYSMVEEAWKLAIEAQDYQRALAGAPEGTLSVSQLPGSPSLNIDPYRRAAVSIGFCSMLLYQITDIDYSPKYA